MGGEELFLPKYICVSVKLNYYPFKIQLVQTDRQINGFIEMDAHACVQ